jgi:hypothetical protein
VLERHRALIVSNLHAWNAALIAEHLEPSGEPVSAGPG